MSSGIAIWRILQARIERKSSYFFTSSHHKYRNCRIEWTSWTILGNSKTSNQPAVERFPTFPVNRQLLRPETWNLLGTSGNVFDSPRAVTNSSSTPYQGMLHSWNQCATSGNPVRDSTGKLVAGSEERNRETIPTPRFARRPSTMNSFFLSSHRITWLINQDFRSRSFNLINFPHPQRFHVGR